MYLRFTALCCGAFCELLLRGGWRSASRCLILMVNSGLRRHTKMQLRAHTRAEVVLCVYCDISVFWFCDEWANVTCRQRRWSGVYSHCWTSDLLLFLRHRHRWLIRSFIHTYCTVIQVHTTFKTHYTTVIFYTITVFMLFYRHFTTCCTMTHCWLTVLWHSGCDVYNICTVTYSRAIFFF